MSETGRAAKSKTGLGNTGKPDSRKGREDFANKKNTGREREFGDKKKEEGRHGSAMGGREGGRGCREDRREGGREP